MERKIVLKQDILDALLSVGVSKGQTIMVHTSLSSLGFVCGGAQMVIEALIEAVGNEGTIMILRNHGKTLIHYRRSLGGTGRLVAIDTG